MRDVELLKENENSVYIKTNEGLMDRTNIKKKITETNIVINLDENYDAGSRVTVKSHYREEFTKIPTGFEYHIIISEIDAPGILGFLFRKFGKRSTGKAYLNGYKTYFESLNER